MKEKEEKKNTHTFQNANTPAQMTCNIAQQPTGAILLSIWHHRKGNSATRHDRTNLPVERQSKAQSLALPLSFGLAIVPNIGQRDRGHFDLLPNINV